MRCSLLYDSDGLSEETAETDNGDDEACGDESKDDSNETVSDEEESSKDEVGDIDDVVEEGD